MPSISIYRSSIFSRIYFTISCSDMCFTVKKSIISLYLYGVIIQERKISVENKLAN